jgi:hypothetical protein
MTWTEYWNEDTTVYVNDRHRRVHYRDVARDILAVLPAPGARVVDYGCGDALSADAVADECAHLYLCDSAPRVRKRLAGRYCERTDISVVSPEQFEALGHGSIDVIVANSVVQYLSLQQFHQFLKIAREKLAGAGLLVLGDIVPRDLGMAADAAELLKFARAHGFLLPAAAGLVRSFFSDYRRMRAKFGLLRFDEDQIVAMLNRAGFRAIRHPNLGHNTQRMTFIAWPGAIEAASAPEAELTEAMTAH